MTRREAGRGTAVVALKPGHLAKSRLANLGDALRQELAWAMAVDTLTSLSAMFDEILVVGSARRADLSRLRIGVYVVDDPDTPGMNAALAHGASTAVARGAETVLACVGDLPALTVDSVDAVLTAAARSRRSFVSDASGVGTTMLIAHCTPLDPRFGGRSAVAHAKTGARPLTLNIPDARTDVDTDDDLAAAQLLGLGPATQAVINRATQFQREIP